MIDAVGTRDRTSLGNRLAMAIGSAEVYATFDAWCVENDLPRPIGMYLLAGDGDFVLEAGAPHHDDAPSALPWHHDPPRDGVARVDLSYRARPFAAVLLESATRAIDLAPMLEEELAPAWFRALYLDDALATNERMRQQLYYLDEMGKLIGRLDLDLLLVNILELTSAHLGADIGSLTLLRQDDIETAVDWGLPHEAITGLTLRDGTPALRRALESRTPLLLEAEDLAPGRDASYNFEHMLLLPLCTSEAVWGSINLVAPSRVDSLDSPHLQSIRSGVGLAATAVENALLFRIKVAREREQEQLKVGQQIQNALLPSEAPKVGGLDVAGSSVSATMIGGDYYDYFQLPDGRLGLVVADVAGKGVPAGLIMTATRALFRAAAVRSCDPALILEDVNRLLCADGFGSRFVTALFAAIDPLTGEVRYSTAGHDAPLLLRRDRGTTEDHPLPALPLGLRSSASYAELAVRLQPGDMMVLYTDGVTEAMNATREQFGVARLADVLLQPERGERAKDVRDAIVAAVDAHCAGTPRHDDTTLIVVHRPRSEGGST